MKLIITLFVALSLIGCSNSEYKMERLDRMGKIEYRNGPSSTLVISEVIITNNAMKGIEKNFNRSLKSIVQNEFSNNNFKVLAREELKNVMNEYYFNKEILGNPTKHSFIASDYTVNVKITNIGLSDSGIFIPILYNKLDHSIEISAELTVINNKTGEIFGSSGSGKVTYTTTNLLILIGDLNSSYSIPLENALKLAIRDAIIKTKI